MNNTAISTSRNLTLECCRIVAAFFVVFLHVPFPGTFGGLIACLSRFAVPMFFAISGYFSYHAGAGKLLRRYLHILLLELTGIGLQLTWKCFEGLYQGVSPLITLISRIPDGQKIADWLLIQVDPFAGHLWYLSAAAACYLALSLYTRLHRGRVIHYQPLYILSFFLLAAHFAMAEFSRYTGIRVDYTLYRNAWFFGIPMFTLGLGLRQYRQTHAPSGNGIIPLAAMAAGIGLSIAEWFRFGAMDLHIGTVVTVAALMLFATDRPQIPSALRPMVKHFGFLSTGIYLVHLIVNDVYNAFFGWKLAGFLGAGEAWLKPVLVAAVSLAAALAGLLLTRLLKIRK